MLSMGDRKPFLTDEERREADNMPGDQLDRMTDIAKLHKFEKYYRAENFGTTADRCIERLKALCALPDDLDPRNSQDKESARDEILKFAKQMATQTRTAPPSSSLEVPVRSSAGRKRDRDSSSNSIADVSMEERLYQADLERKKGSESFRAKEYVEAAQYYTKSINWLPTATAFANRAAVHVHNREWEAVIEDCTKGLALCPEPDLEVKLRLRRSASYMKMNHPRLALEDIQAGLAISPDCSELHKYRQEAEKALGKVMTKKIAIEEVSDEDDDNDDDDDQSNSNDGKDQNGNAAEPTIPLKKEAILNLKFRPIPVVEFTDSDCDNNEPEVGTDVQPVDTHVRNAEIDLVLPAKSGQQSEEWLSDDVDVNNSSSRSTAAAPPSEVIASIVERTKPGQLEADCKESLEDSEDDSDSDIDSELELQLEPPVDEASAKDFLNGQGEHHKTKGNKLFAEQKYNQALFCYQDALKFLPASPHLHNNCAIARVHINSLDQAIKDSTIAITLKPDYAKAYWKRADAKQGLNLLEDALEDLKTCESLYKTANEFGQVRKIALSQSQLKQKLRDRAKESEKRREANTHHYQGSFIIEEEDEVDAEITRQRRKVEKLQQDAALEAKKLLLKSKQLEEEHLKRLQAEREERNAQLLAAAQEKQAAKRAAAQAEKRKRKEAKLASRRAAATAAQAAQTAKNMEEGVATDVAEVQKQHEAMPRTETLPASATVQIEQQAKTCKAYSSGVSPDTRAPITPVSASSPSPNAQQSRQEQFEAEKEAVNKIVKSGGLQEGLTIYTDMLKAYPEHSTVLNLNKALVLIRLERLDEAVSLCTELLSQPDLELPQKAKALHRRALALMKLQQLREATTDAEAALQLVPALMEQQQEQIAEQLKDFHHTLMKESEAHQELSSRQHSAQKTNSSSAPVATSASMEEPQKPRDTSAAAAPCGTDAGTQRKAEANEASCSVSSISQPSAAVIGKKASQLGTANGTAAGAADIVKNASQPMATANGTTAAARPQPASNAMTSTTQSRGNLDSMQHLNPEQLAAEVATLKEQLAHLKELQNRPWGSSMPRDLATEQKVADLEQLVNRVLSMGGLSGSSTQAAGTTAARAGSVVKEVTEADQKRAEDFKKQGNQLVVQKEWKKALVAYNCSLSKDPNNERVLGNRALVHIKLEQFDEAAEDARRAIELGNSEGKIRFRLAFALKEAGRDQEAYHAAMDMMKTFEDKGDTQGKSDPQVQELLGKIMRWKQSDTKRQQDIAQLLQMESLLSKRADPLSASNRAISQEGNQHGKPSTSHQADTAPTPSSTPTSTAAPAAPIRTPPLPSPLPASASTPLTATTAATAVSNNESTPSSSNLSSAPTGAAAGEQPGPAAAAAPTSVHFQAGNKEDLVKAVLDNQLPYTRGFVTKKIVIEEVDSSSSDDDNADASDKAPSSVAASNGNGIGNGNKPQQQQRPGATQSASSTAKGPGTSSKAAAASPAPGQAGIQAALSKAAAAVSIQQQQQQQVKLEPPRSVAVFDQTCSRLLAGGQTQRLVQFVKALDPARYQSFFKDSLSGAAVQGIVNAMAACAEEEGELVLRSLGQLAEVKRFSIMVNLAKGVKGTLSSVLSKLEKSGLEVPAALRKQYGSSH